MLKRLPWLISLFAILSVFFLVGLIFFQFPFPLYPLVSWKDVIDLITPFSIVPLYWLMFKAASRRSPGWLEDVAFITLSSLWVLGQGMHLTANSIGNLTEYYSESGRLNILDTNIYALTYFFDEKLGHYLWHTAIIGMAVLLIVREWRVPSGETASRWVLVAAGLLHGGTLFIIFVEGQTTPLGFPFALLASLVLLALGARKFKERPLLVFFSTSFFAAAILMAIWGFYFHGFPELSEFSVFNIPQIYR